MPRIFISTLLIISLMFFPVIVGSVMESPNFRIQYKAITPGGGIGQSPNHKMLGTLGEIGPGRAESPGYQVGAGMVFGIQADQPPTPTLLNTGAYNSLNFRINRGYELDSADPSLVAHYKFNQDPLIDSYVTTGVASETIGTTANTKIAQKFQAGSATHISAIDIFQTAAGNLIGNIRIETDSDGNPSGNLVHINAFANNITLNAGSSTHIPLNAISNIIAGMEYWLVFTPVSGSGTFQGNTAGIADQVKYFDGVNWHYSVRVESLYFRVQSRVRDWSDTGNFGKVIGPKTADGRFGRALQFDGVNDRVEVPDAPSLDLVKFTVSFWVFHRVLKDHSGLVIKGLDARENFEVLTFANGVIHTSIRWTDGTRSTLDAPAGTAVPNKWQHFTLTYDGTVRRIYVDGAVVASDAPGKTPAFNDFQLTIGCEQMTAGTFARVFNGLIDEIGIYNRVKTDLEIARASQIDNPEDAEYAIAISDDNWTTTKYIQTDNTLGGSMVWQTYANWGSGNGETLTGLKQETESKMKTKARQGDFTETGWSSETSAKTSALSLSFSINKTWVDLGTLVPNEKSSDSHLLTVSTNGEQGFVITIQEDGNLRLGDGLRYIADVTDGTVDRGEEYGVRTSGSADGRMSVSDTAITSDVQTIASNTGPVAPSVVTVTFKAVVDPHTFAGKYSHIVTYITTATF